MGVVVIVVVVVVVLAVVGIVVWALRRRDAAEVHSVEGYRQTLDTLSGINAHATTGSVRTVGSAGTSDAEEDPSDLHEDLASSVARRRGRDLVFVDSSAGDTMSVGNKRTQDRAMSAMNHRPRRVGAPI